MVACLPCAAAAGPPGVALAAAGAVGYGIFKTSKTKKKSKSKKQKGGSDIINFNQAQVNRLNYFSSRFVERLRQSLHGNNYETNRDKASDLKSIIKKYLTTTLNPNFDESEANVFVDKLAQIANTRQSTNRDMIRQLLHESYRMTGGNHLKKGEIVRVKFKTGNKRDFKFVRYFEDDQAVLKFLNKNKKGTVTINLNRIEKIPKTIANTKKRQKTIANTKKRQKTKRAKLVRTKRGIKTKSSTLELPKIEESIDDLLSNLEI